MDGITITVDGLPYVVSTVNGRLFINGEEFPCVIDHENRTIQVSDLVPLEMRAAVVAKAVSAAWAQRQAGMCRVPIVGFVA